MATRGDATRAIQRWTDLKMPQRELARRAFLSESAISHLKNTPEYSCSAKSYNRICEVVCRELSGRIASIPMRLISLCHNADTGVNDDTDAAVTARIRALLGGAATELSENPKVDFPIGVDGALCEVGPPGSGVYLVAVRQDDADDARRALAHEFEHIRMRLLEDVEGQFRAPRSAF